MTVFDLEPMFRLVSGSSIKTGQLVTTAMPSIENNKPFAKVTLGVDYAAVTDAGAIPVPGNWRGRGLI